MNEMLTGFYLHSFVQTEMGNSSAVLFGLEKAHISVEESVSGLVKVVSPRRKDSSRGACHGRFADRNWWIDRQFDERVHFGEIHGL
jgi:hypothetical protein